MDLCYFKWSHGDKIITIKQFVSVLGENEIFFALISIDLNDEKLIQS